MLDRHSSEVPHLFTVSLVLEVGERGQRHLDSLSHPFLLSECKSKSCKGALFLLGSIPAGRLGQPRHRARRSQAEAELPNKSGQKEEK